MSTQTLTFSSPETSPEASASRSPPYSRSPPAPFPPFFSLSPAAFRAPPACPTPLDALSPLASQCASPGPAPRSRPDPSSIPPTSHPTPRVLSEQDILHSAIIPTDHKPTIVERLRQLHFVLAAPNRAGSGFHASGANHADRLVAAEQLARMSKVYRWYTDVLGGGTRSLEDAADEKCESTATDMLDAGQCASGWRGTWENPSFVVPLCLLGKDREVAELTSSCLGRFQRMDRPSSRRTSNAVRNERSSPRAVPALSADSILEWWQRPIAQSTEIVRISTRQRSHTLTAHVNEPEVHGLQRHRSRTHADVLHAAEVSSAGQEDVDHEIWTQCADRAQSPSREIEIVWPPCDSLEGYCLIDKVPHRERGVFLAGRLWLYDVTSHYFRKALHPWCLRCFRTRCRVRGSSRNPRFHAMLDAMFMLFGILIVLAMELYIAWTDERVPQGAPILEKIGVAWSLFLEKEVQEAEQCGRIAEPGPAPSRRRAISCPF